MLKLRPIRGTEDERWFAAAAAPGHGGDEAPGIALFRQTRDFLAASPRPDPWGSYLALEDDEAVGVCAFKSAPDPSGAVEIAYATFPVHQGRGVAQAMIGALLNLAFGAGASVVLARTLPEPNASNAALRRLGFISAGEVMDPDDGLVWEWRRTRA